MKNMPLWCLIGGICFFCACSSDQDPEPEPEPTQWTRLADKPGQAIRGAASFAIGESGYVVSGFSGDDTVTPEVYQYHAPSGVWSKMADMPAPRVDAGAFSVNGLGFVCMGSSAGQLLSDLWQYDPRSDVWTRKADFPAAPRLLPAIMVHEGKAYVVGGGSTDQQCYDLWCYDPAGDTWERRSDFPGQGTSAAFVIGDTGYVCCGLSSGDPWVDHKELWAYRFALDVWTRKADFGGTGRGYAQGMTLAGKAYVGLGVEQNGMPMGVCKDLWAYDPATDTWIRQPDLPATGRGMFVAFSVGEVGYFGLGGDRYNNNLSDLWRFTTSPQ